MEYEHKAKQLRKVISDLDAQAQKAPAPPTYSSGVDQSVAAAQWDEAALKQAQNRYFDALFAKEKFDEDMARYKKESAWIPGPVRKTIGDLWYAPPTDVPDSTLRLLENPPPYVGLQDRAAHRERWKAQKR